MPTRIVGTSENAVAGATMVVPLPVGWAPGDLFWLPLCASVLSNTLGTLPAGWVALDDTLAATEGFAIIGRIAESGDTAPTIQPWASGANVGQITAIRPDSGKAFPVIGSIIAGKTTSTPATAATARYSGHTVVGNGNILMRATGKNASLGATPTAIANTSGYTSCGFATRTSNCMVASEMLTAVTAIGTDATNADPTVTGLSTATNRVGVTIELVQQSSMAVTTDASVYATSTADGNVLIQVTRVGGNYPSAPTATLFGQALTRNDYSGAIANFRMPLSSLFNLGEAFAGLNFYVNAPLVVTDSSGNATVNIQVAPPNDDDYDTLAGGDYDYAPATSADGDFCFVDRLSGGTGISMPKRAGFYGNSVPSVVAFRVFKGSAWLDAVVKQFDVAAGTYDGQIYDHFADADGTNLSAHTPDANIVGGAYVHERDVVTAPAISGDHVNIVGNQAKITAANQGFTLNAGTVNPNFMAFWVCTADDNRFSMHVRRLDDANHIHLFVTKDGTLSLNQRVAGVNVGLTGETSYVFPGGFLAGRTYYIRPKVMGELIEVFLDELLVMTAYTSQAPNFAATKVGIYSGGSAYIGAGVIFEGINIYTDYVAGRTLTFSNNAPNPGDVVTCTVVGAAFATAIDVGELAGVAFTPGAADTDSFTLTIPDYSAFDEAGAHINTPLGQSVPVEASDGVGTAAVGTLTITPHVLANFGTIEEGVVLAPPETEDGDKCYIRVVSGAGTGYPRSANFVPTAPSSIWVMVFGESAQAWRARREVTIGVIAALWAAIRKR